MTDDKELIASLRGKGFSFMEKAADRIEELEDKLEKVIAALTALQAERDAWKARAEAEEAVLGG